MSITFEIDRRKENITIAAVGDVYESDFRLLWQKLRSDSAFEPEYSFLINLIGASHLHMASADIAAIAMTEVFSSQSKRALVASKQELFGIAYEFQAHSGSGYATGVFPSTYEAREWLGIK